MNVEKVKFPYKNKQSYVFTRSRNDPNDYVEFVDGDIVEFVNSLKRDEGKIMM